MNVIDRIYKYIDFKGLTTSKFAEKAGVSNGYFTKQKVVNGSIGSKIIEKIVVAFPDLNPEWLLFGKGEMLTKEGEEAMWKALEPTGPSQYELKLQENKDLRLIIETQNKLIKMQEERIAELKQQLKHPKT